MDFTLSDIHDDLASSIDALLSRADIPAVARAWADGDRDPAAKVYAQLADVGVFGLLIGEEHGGAGAGAVEMVVAMEQLGRYAVPGPLAETLAAVPTLLGGVADDSPDAADALAAIAGGRTATLAVAPEVPGAADAGAADLVYVVSDGTLATGEVESTAGSVDPTRTVSRLRVQQTITETVDPANTLRVGALATAAQLVGLGRGMLAVAADYAKTRNQFGRPIGSFQAVKHHLADVAIALEMARPLVYAAALGLDGAVPDDTDVSRDVSAAKVAAADAAHLAYRQSLQVLGAIGYTAEHDLSLSLTKSRALIGAWGTPALHRSRVLETL